MCLVFLPDPVFTEPLNISYLNQLLFLLFNCYIHSNPVNLLCTIAAIDLFPNLLKTTKYLH